MTIKEQVDADLKKAMLAGDKPLVSTLRGLKSTILYAEVAAGRRDEGLSDDAVIPLFQKEAKKRQESADLYRQGNNEEKAAAEEAEKLVTERYLPAQMDEEEVQKLVNEVVAGLDEPSMAQMGTVISEVKKRSSGTADGAIIARLTKERLGQ